MLEPFEFSGDKLTNFFYLEIGLFIVIQLVKLTTTCSGDYCGEYANAWAIATTCVFASCTLTWFHWAQEMTVSGLMSRFIELFTAVAQISFLFMFLWGIDGGAVDDAFVWICAIILVVVFVVGAMLRLKGAPSSA